MALHQHERHSGDGSAVGIRLLHNRTSEIVKQVAEGRSIDVTLRGTVVARLVPAESVDPFADLRRRGLISDPMDSDWMPNPDRPRPSKPVSELVSEMRR